MVAIGSVSSTSIVASADILAPPGAPTPPPGQPSPAGLPGRGARGGEGGADLGGEVAPAALDRAVAPVAALPQVAEEADQVVAARPGRLAAAVGDVGVREEVGRLVDRLERLPLLHHVVEVG